MGYVDDNPGPFAILLFLLCIILFGAGGLVTGSEMNRIWKDESVEKGYAIYYLDENHVKEWRWLDIVEIEKNEEETKIKGK